MKRAKIENYVKKNHNKDSKNKKQTNKEHKLVRKKSDVEHGARLIKLFQKFFTV